MGFLAWIGRTLAPIVLKHGAPMLRDWWKGRAAQPKSKTDQVQQLASDVEQLKAQIDVLSSDLDTLNSGFTTREERLRRWVLTLLIWNIAMTLGLVLVAVFAFRR
jgi:hypothetical protein